MATIEDEGFPRLRGGGGPPTLIELNHTQHRMHVEWGEGLLSKFAARRIKRGHSLRRTAKIEELCLIREAVKAAPLARHDRALQQRSYDLGQHSFDYCFFASINREASVVAVAFKRNVTSDGDAPKRIAPTLARQDSVHSLSLSFALLSEHKPPNNPPSWRQRAEKCEKGLTQRVHRRK